LIILRSVFLALILFIFVVGPAYAQQSTSGPNPPPGMDPGRQNITKSQVVLSDFPVYLWHHGCGPTTVGMVIGYWDGHGCDNMVPGDAVTQTDAVNDMIADDDQNPSCSGSASNHFQDYCCPIDYYPNLYTDLSQTGGAHADNCVADFMETSRSSRSNRYGWSWYSDIPDAFIDYVNLVAPEYSPNAVNLTYSNFSFADFRNEIDDGRPVVLLVDSDGDGFTDHFVPAIGYDNTTREYACLNTWDTNIHWYSWRALSSSYSWGIYGATIFDVSIPACVDLTPLSFYLNSAQNIYPGEILNNRLHAIVSNLGNTIADSSIVGFYISTNSIISKYDQLLVDGEESIGPVLPGDSIMIAMNGAKAIPSGWPPGPAYLGIFVDHVSEITECNESNNTACIPIIVADSSEYMAAITGHVYYYDPAKKNPDVEIDIVPTDLSLQTTDADGYYRFEYLIPDTYTLGAIKNDNDPGVSIADIVKIRRHLAELETFDSPYKMIAADVNNSGSVSVADVIKLRRYLAQLEDLPGGNWIFIDSAFAIDDSNWSAASQSIIVPLSGSDVNNASFVGVRIGDVNDTWSPNTMAKSVSSTSATIQVGSASGSKGEMITIPLIVQNRAALAGAELHVAYDISRLRFVRVNSLLPGDIIINSTNGMVHIIWEDINNSINTTDNQTLINLQFVILPDLIDQTDIEITDAELVDKLGTPYQLDIKQGRVTRNVPSVSPKDYALERNRPNPFNPITEISFSLPSASEVHLDIYNLMGQRVTRLVNGILEAGSHTYLWDAGDAASGIYFYRLQAGAGAFTATRKMILLK
jgi:hypothetical protein